MKKVAGRRCRSRTGTPHSIWQRSPSSKVNDMICIHRFSEWSTTSTESPHSFVVLVVGKKLVAKIGHRFESTTVQCNQCRVNPERICSQFDQFVELNHRCSHLRGGRFPIIVK